MKLLNKEELDKLSEFYYADKIYIKLIDQARLVEPLVQALRFYANEYNYDHLDGYDCQFPAGSANICEDYGDKAREALKLVEE